MRLTLQVVLTAVAVGAALWTLFRVEGVLLLLALSVLFAYMVAPMVHFFCRPIPRLKGWGLKLPVAILLAYVVLFGLAAAAAYFVWPVVSTQLSELRSQAPAYVSRLQAEWKTWKAGQTRVFSRDVRAAIEGLVDQATAGALAGVRDVLLPRIGSWLMSVPWLVLVPIFAFFLIKDADLFRRRTLALFLEKRWRWRGDLFFEEVSRSLAAYVRALVAGGVVVAVLCAGGFVLLRVPYPMLLGAAAGLFELLPLVGPFVIAVVVVALTALQSPSSAILVAAFLLVVRVVEDYVIYPRLVGRELPLHPMAVILAILCGAEIGGAAGVLFAVPVLATLTVAYRHWRAHRAAESPRPAAL
ncbi:MAG TPA: AI-2E family transporter [Thermoanaerobaculia bacterium]|nr:AI-2E family transporter [Thermoanaerobaculia bacterium]